MFEPIGAVSRRRMVIDHFGAQPEGVIVGYDELADILEVEDRRAVTSAVNAAKPGLEREHAKAVAPVRLVGYRIVLAAEHLGLAQLHQKKSTRQLTRSKSKVIHVDLSGLTEGERLAVQLAATSLGRQLEYMRRNDIRSSRIEAAVAVIQSGQARSQDEIDELKARLARLEGNSGPG